MLGRDDVVQLGDVLAGTAEGRRSDREITVFDSTGLAIQDLAIALSALERAGGSISRRSTFRRTSSRRLPSAGSLNQNQRRDWLRPWRWLWLPGQTTAR